MRPLQLSVPAVAALIALSALPADAGTPDSRGAAQVEVAEVLAATPDGRTVRYTDSAQQEVGVVDPLRPPTPAAPAAGRSPARRPAGPAAAG